MLTLNYPNYCRVPPAVGRAHNGSARCSLETIVVRESRTRCLRRVRKTVSWLTGAHRLRLSMLPDVCQIPTQDRRAVAGGAKMLKVTRENGGQNRGQRELRHEAMLQGVDGVADDRAQCVLGECDLCERESYVDEWPLAKRHVAHDSDCEDWSTVQKGEEASSSAARLNIVEQADMCAKGARGGKRNHVGRDGAQCGDEPTPPQAKDKDRDPGKEVWNARDEHERLACNKEAEEKERTAQNAKALHALLQAGAVEEDSICTRQDEKHGHAGKESHEPRQSPTALLNLKFKKTLIAPGRDDHGRAPTFPRRVNRGGPPIRDPQPKFHKRRSGEHSVSCQIISLAR